MMLDGFFVRRFDRARANIFIIMRNIDPKVSSVILAAAGGTLLAQSSSQAAITTYDENTQAPGGDFGGTFALRLVLPVGTTTVNGDMEFSGGTDPDFYTYTGLIPGQTFTLDITAGDAVSFYQATFQVLDDTQTQIGATAIYAFNDPSGTMRQITGTVPGTGNLTVDIQQSAEGGGAVPSYTTTLSVVPEPATATLALLGAVVAALVAKRRGKRRGCISSKES